MNNDINSQFDRAKELLCDLHSSYDNDFKSQQISEKTRNLVQEILVKLRSILDQGMYVFFEKNILPALSPADSKQAKSNVYFPLAKEENGMKSILGKAHIKGLDETHPKVYNFLLACQPFSDYRLGKLQEWSNSKHRQLIPHVKKESNETVVPGILRVSKEAKGVTLINCKVIRQGVEIQLPNTHDLNETPICRYDSRLKATPWFTICFEESDIDVYVFCRDMIEVTKKIVFDFLELIK